MSRDEQIERASAAFVDAFWRAIPSGSEGAAVQQKFIFDELTRHLDDLLNRFVRMGASKLASPNAVKPVATAVASLQVLRSKVR